MDPALTVNAADAIFEPQGDLFQPTAAAVGPWDPGALHGGPVAMLVARALEACPADDEMDLVRLTLELLRPVPTKPLAVSARVERPGRRIQVLGAAVSVDGVDVAWARALRVRREDLGVDTVPDPPPAPPESIEPWGGGGFGPGFGRQGVEVRFVDGSVEGPGPATVWVRLKLPVIAGETPSQFQRVAAAADFGNGFSWVLDWAKYIFVNPDLTISLSRPAEGEWIAMASKTLAGPGHGLAESALYDRRGKLGWSLQSLFLGER